MKVQEFIVRFNGEAIDKDQLERIIYKGLQWYEDIHWKQYVVTKEGRPEEGGDLDD